MHPISFLYDYVHPHIKQLHEFRFTELPGGHFLSMCNLEVYLGCPCRSIHCKKKKKDKKTNPLPQRDRCWPHGRCQPNLTISGEK